MSNNQYLRLKHCFSLCISHHVNFALVFYLSVCPSVCFSYTSPTPICLLLMFPVLHLPLSNNNPVTESAWPASHYRASSGSFHSYISLATLLLTGYHKGYRWSTLTYPIKLCLPSPRQWNTQKSSQYNIQYRQEIKCPLIGRRWRVQKPFSAKA